MSINAKEISLVFSQLPLELGTVKCESTRIASRAILLPQVSNIDGLNAKMHGVRSEKSIFDLASCLPALCSSIHSGKCSESSAAEAGLSNERVLELVEFEFIGRSFHYLVDLDSSGVGSG